MKKSILNVLKETETELTSNNSREYDVSVLTHTGILSKIINSSDAVPSTVFSNIGRVDSIKKNIASFLKEDRMFNNTFDLVFSIPHINSQLDTLIGDSVENNSIESIRVIMNTYLAVGSINVLSSAINNNMWLSDLVKHNKEDALVRFTTIPDFTDTPESGSVIDVSEDMLKKISDNDEKENSKALVRVLTDNIYRRISSDDKLPLATSIAMIVFSNSINRSRFTKLLGSLDNSSGALITQSLFTEVVNEINSEVNRIVDVLAILDRGPIISDSIVNVSFEGDMLDYTINHDLVAIICDLFDVDSTIRQDVIELYVKEMCEEYLDVYQNDNPYGVDFTDATITQVGLNTFVLNVLFNLNESFDYERSRKGIMKVIREMESKYYLDVKVMELYILSKIFTVVSPLGVERMFREMNTSPQTIEDAVDTYGDIIKLIIRYHIDEHGYSKYDELFRKFKLALDPIS